MHKTGIKPVEYKVLIKIDDVEETYGDMKIIIPHTSQEKEQHGQNRGILFATSPSAFSGQPFEGRIPQIGDRVIFSKYKGEVIEFTVFDDPKENETERETKIRERGKKELYRLCNDKDVCAILEVEDGN